jgi:hypothetical protein
LRPNHAQRVTWNSRKGFSCPKTTTPDRWKAVPPGHMVAARAGRPVTIAPFLSELQVAAE